MINQQRRKLLGAGSLLAGVSALSLTANAMGAKATLAQNNNRNAENAIMAENVYLNLNDVQFLFADLHPALVNTSITNSPGQLAGNAGSLAKVASVLKIPMLFLTVTKGG
jgi:predicted RNA methylase